MDEQSLHTDTVHDWITGYLTNSLTPEEMQSFQEWLNASEENRKYFSDIQEVWIAASNEADELQQRQSLSTIPETNRRNYPTRYQ